MSSIIFFDKIKNKKITIFFNEDLKRRLEECATSYPYPVIVQHDGHFSVVYLDKDGKERGTFDSNLLIRLDRKRINNVIDNVKTSSNLLTKKVSKKSTKKSKITSESKLKENEADNELKSLEKLSDLGLKEI